MRTRNFNKRLLTTAVLAFFICGAAAQADPTLTFEGVGDSAFVDGFYNGGTDSAGNSGVNYGVDFSSSAAIGVIESESGGTGFFGGEPSSATVLESNTEDATFSVSGGFTDVLSLFYDLSAGNTGSISIYDGLNGTGSLLASQDLSATQSGTECGFPDLLCSFEQTDVSFSGTALSVVLNGPVGNIAYDDLTLGAGAPVGVPEPSALALFALGLAGLGFFGAMRRKNRKSSS